MRSVVIADCLIRLDGVELLDCEVLGEGCAVMR